MGGSTKIGIGRTTRVKAVSMIAWGKRQEHCAHASFQGQLWVSFNSLFYDSRALERQSIYKTVNERETAGMRNGCDATSDARKATHMSGSNFGGSHHFPTVIQHIDSLRQLVVSHQAHVTDVCTRWGGRETDTQRGSFNNLISSHGTRTEKKWNFMKFL